MLLMSLLSSYSAQIYSKYEPIKMPIRLIVYIEILSLSENLLKAEIHSAKIIQRRSGIKVSAAKGIDVISQAVFLI